MKKVLLVYTAALGYGHKRSLQAIKKALDKYYPTNKTYIVNTISNTNPILEKLFGHIKKYALKSFPWYWNLIYNDDGFLLKSISFLEKNLENMLIPNFKSILYKYNPDIIVTTQAFASRIFSKIRNKNKLNFKILSITTDFHIREHNIKCGADLFIVPNNKIKDLMLKKGIKNTIKVLGIPIGLEFNNIKDKKQLQKKYNLRQTTTILILGGGSGLGYIENIIRKIKNSDIDAQIIVSVGVNKFLGEKLKQHFSDIHIAGYTENIDELYHVSDIAITKPGGLTTSELLAMEIPMIITNPLPGLEQKNSDYLVEQNVAIYSKSIDDIPKVIKSLTSDKKRSNNMKKNSQILSRPKAALHVAKVINGI